MATSENRNLTLLNGENYDRWRIDIKMLLMDKGSWLFIAEDKEPALAKDASSKETRDYNLRRDRVFSTIYYGIEEEYRPLIQDCKSGREAWFALEKQFQPKTRARIIHLLDEFFSTRYVDGEEMGLFVSRIKLAIKKLEDAGQKIDGIFKGFQLIRNLPNEYAGIVQIIYRWTDEEFTIDKIADELIREESRIQQLKVDAENDVKVKAFNTSSLVKKGNVNRHEDVKGPVKNCFKVYGSKHVSKAKDFKPNKVGPCFKCGMYGHTIKFCKSKGEVNKRKVTEVNNKYEASVASCFFEDKHEALLTENYRVNEANQVDTRYDKYCWIIDTAATTHFSNNLDLFSDYEEISNVKMSTAIGDEDSDIKGKGTVKFKVRSNGGINEIVLRNVLYNPKLRRNLLSGARFENAGAHFVGSKGKIWVYTPDWNKLFFAKRRGGLYYFKPTSYEGVNTQKKIHSTSNTTDVSKKVYNMYTSSMSNKEIANLWHQRYGHVNFKYLVDTSKNNSVRGIPKIVEPKEACVSCKLAKSSRVSFKPTLNIRSKKPLQLVHMDVCGPFPTTSHSGCRYFLSIIDDFSRHVSVYPIKNKSEVFEKFKRYQSRAERSTGLKVLSVRTDNGLEFVNKDFTSFLEKQGIRSQRTNTYTPEQNGVCERYNRTVVDNIKAMLKSSNLSDKFWAEAVVCFSYVFNRLCHKNDKTPLELYSGHKPSVAHLKVFGSRAFVGVPKQLRHKLDMRSKLGIMVGYAQNTRGYRIWLDKENKLIETCNVRFDESSRGVEAVLDPKEQKLGYFRISNSSEESDSSEESHSSKESHSSEESDSSEEGSEMSEDDDRTEEVTIPTKVVWVREAVPRKDSSKTDIYYKIEGTKSRLRSPKEVRVFCEKRGIEYNAKLFNFSGKNLYSGKVDDMPEANLLEVKIPRNYKEAIKVPEARQWRSAMQEEMDVMREREVWKLVPKPSNKKILGSRWVFTTKKNEKNEIVRYKARLVAKGFDQRKGESYEEIFSPVVNFSVIRMFFAIFVCLLGWMHCQLDIKCAYLYARLDEDIYMHQPEGFTDETRSNFVCLLKRALYGLHQSSRQWFLEMDQALADLNFLKIEWCNCAYRRKHAIIMLYVDDIIIFGKTQETVDQVIKDLKRKFDLKVLGKTKKLLGIEFMDQNGKLYIHQKSYIEKVWETYKKFKIPITSLPITRGDIISKLDSPSTEEEIKEMNQIPYRNLLGCLSFIANRTRPDISYAVNTLSQMQSNPGIRHWKILLKLMGYVKSTASYMLDLSRISNLSVSCFSDADFATNRDDRISVGGIIIFVDRVPVSWRTFKQKGVSLSTMESEYVALTEAAKELMWLKNILVDEGLNLQINDCKLYCDNQAAIGFAKSPIENSRTKHIDVKLHFLRDLVVNKVFIVKYVQSKQNMADIFTKPLSKFELQKFCKEVFV